MHFLRLPLLFALVGFAVFAPAQTEDGKPAVKLNCETPEGKKATLFFDKESGLPLWYLDRIRKAVLRRAALVRGP
jgi:hypothetical protein